MRSSTLKSVVAVVAAALLISPAAMAREIFLNGVNIGAVRGQTFKNTTVFIDDNGDVHIDAPSYKVEVIDEDAPATAKSAAAPTAGANPKLRSRYYMATKPAAGNRAQYDLVIKINGVERQIVKAASGPIIEEISAWLEKGENKVEVIARKDLAGGRRSIAAEDDLELIIGAGHEEGTLVKIDLVHVSFKCDASQISEIKRVYTINAI